MEKELFDGLTRSLKQAVAISKGEMEAARRYVVEEQDVKAIRENLGLTQSEFASLIRVNVRTLQNWEQKHRHPAGPAAALLKIAAKAPQVVVEALHA
jgi:DNA-binding transcriptional regulator YiaG